MSKFIWVKRVSYSDAGAAFLLTLFGRVSFITFNQVAIFNSLIPMEYYYMIASLFLAII